MKTNRLRKTIDGAALALLRSLGIVAAAAATTSGTVASCAAASALAWELVTLKGKQVAAQRGLLREPSHHK